MQKTPSFWQICSAEKMVSGLQDELRELRGFAAARLPHHQRHLRVWTGVVST